MAFKYIFFDVANTLLQKPDLFPNIEKVLKDNHYDIPSSQIKKVHKILSESVIFPDKTSKTFYDIFNKELLYALGILPTEELINDVFQACTYLPWKPFDDTLALNNINIPMGIISNWDTSLPEKLKKYFPDTAFDKIFTSEIEQVKKPDPAFFLRALKALDCSETEVLYVGDSIKLDMEPALALGIHAILIDREDVFPYYKQPRIKNMAELFGKYL